MGQKPNAYDEGFDAYLNNKTNPYPFGSADATRWNAGLRAAQLYEDFTSSDTLKG